MWEAIFYATAWTIWKVRNDLQFNNVLPKWDEILELMKVTVGFWTKAHNLLVMLLFLRLDLRAKNE